MYQLGDIMLCSEHVDMSVQIIEFGRYTSDDRTIYFKNLKGGRKNRIGLEWKLNLERV